MRIAPSNAQTIFTITCLEFGCNQIQTNNIEYHKNGRLRFLELNYELGTRWIRVLYYFSRRQAYGIEGVSQVTGSELHSWILFFYTIFEVVCQSFYSQERKEWEKKCYLRFPWNLVTVTMKVICQLTITAHGNEKWSG